MGNLTLAADRAGYTTLQQEFLSTKMFTNLALPLLIALCAYGVKAENKCDGSGMDHETRANAEAWCQTCNSTLFRPMTEQENDWTLSNLDSAFFWMDLSDLKSPGDFVYGDGTKPNMTSLPWEKGYPKPPSDGSCVYVNGNNGKWWNTNNKFECKTKAMLFICDKPVKK